MKNKLKFVIGMVVGIIISGITVYATTILSSDIDYDNSKSGSSKTNIQDALDELYDMAKSDNPGGNGDNSNNIFYFAPVMNQIYIGQDYNNLKRDDGTNREVFIKYDSDNLYLCGIFYDKMECFDNSRESRQKMINLFGNCNNNNPDVENINCNGDHNGEHYNCYYNVGSVFCSVRGSSCQLYFDGSKILQCS